MSSEQRKVKQAEREADVENMTPVVITTSHRGVFFGYVQQAKLEETMTLKNARMCVFWPETVKGVLGLAATGPLAGSKIGPAVPSLTVNNVDALMEMTREAVQRWEKGPWT